MEFKFQRHRSDKISKEKVLAELVKVAEIFDYTEFSFREFDKHASISATTAKDAFGSWNKAKNSLKEYLKNKKSELKKRHFRQIYSEKDPFDEMERIWRCLKQRPSAREWEKSDARISLTTYMDLFGGWPNACLKFIEYKMGGEILTDTDFSKNNKRTQKSK